MKVVLDCNVWVQAAERFGRLPRTAGELAQTNLGQIVNAALRGRPLDGQPVQVVVSRHILAVADHVVTLRGWADAGEFGRWAKETILARLLEAGAAGVDLTIEDYPALAARAAQPDGAEDAEDEAVLRCAISSGATLVTADWVLAGVAGRRGVAVHGPDALARRLAR